MSCFVYVIDYRDKVKVGRTQNLQRRIRQLETGAGTAIERYFYISASSTLETAVHRELKAKRDIGEYFTCSFSEALSAVLRFAPHYGAENNGFIVSPTLTNKIKSCYAINGTTQAKVAESIGISRQLLNKKLNTAVFPCEDVALILSTVDIEKCPYWRISP